MNTNFWTNPLNNETYSTPQEVAVLPVNVSGNLPVTKIYMNADELANEWKYERLQSNWLGGEFGHSKTLLELYGRFFTNNQAVGITQHPTGLYRVRLENLRLNRYARAAVDALTRTFNHVLYTDFINTWGTHIVQEATVGKL
jgi:hypothetical protein